MKDVVSAPLDLGTLRQANDARQKVWDPEAKLTVGFHGLELAGEIGEACNVAKKLERERLGLRGSRATLAQLAEELADGIICIDLMARKAGIDLSDAVRTKFNKTSRDLGMAVFLPDGDVYVVETNEWPSVQAQNQNLLARLLQRLRPSRKLPKARWATPMEVKVTRVDPRPPGAAQVLTPPTQR